MYDTTPPGARVSADYSSTSDTSGLSGSAIVIDESDIDDKSNEGVSKFVILLLHRLFDRHFASLCVRSVETIARR